jgi:CHASE2 domain-containing sensor protein
VQYLQPHHTQQVLVGAIDAKSIQDKENGGLGRYQDWSRTYYAQALDNLVKAGARVVAFDIFFSEQAKDRAGDTAFQTSLTKSPIPVILADNVSSTEKLLLPREEFMQKNVTSASVRVMEDSDNIHRSLPYSTDIDHVGFALRITEAFFSHFADYARLGCDSLTCSIFREKIKDPATGITYTPYSFPTYHNGKEAFMVHFFGPSMSIPHISFVDLVNNTFDPKMVKNNIVLIGEMDAGLRDPAE